MIKFESLPQKTFEKNDLPTIAERQSDIKESPLDLETSRKPVPESMDISFIERTSRSALIEQYTRSITDARNIDTAKTTEPIETRIEDLTEEQKAKIKEETGWSDEIIDAISSMEEYEIYRNAGVTETVINGRPCLTKEIDLDYVDEKTGETNRERMEKGKAPIDSKTGEKIEIHHMGQKHDAPFIELCENSEHGNGNHKTLHSSTEKSWRNDLEKKNSYQSEKRQHWQARSKEGVA